MAEACVEVDGIPVSVDPERLQTIEFLELIGEMDDSVAAAPKAMRYVLGDEQYANLKRSLRRDGMTRAVDVVTFFTKVIDALGEQAKNS